MYTIENSSSAITSEAISPAEEEQSIQPIASSLTDTPPEKPKKYSFHFLSGILTFIFLPHFWCFSIPALVFSNEAKKLFEKENYELSHYFADKAKRFIISSWLLTLALGILTLVFIVLISLSLY